MAEQLAQEWVLAAPEFQRLMQAAAHGAYPCRDRAILQIIWESGATVREVLALEPGDVDFLSGSVRWADGRRCGLAAEALRVLTTYVSLERDCRCPRLFAGRHGRPLRTCDVGRLFQRLARQTGIAVDPLALRRAAVARLLRERPIEALAAVRRAAGHS